MATSRTFLAKAIVAIAMGAAVGWFVHASLARDAERGRSLTLNEYTADFTRTKEHLESSESPMAFVVGSLVLLSLGLFGLYEFAGALLSVIIGSLAGHQGRGSSAGEPQR
jgi:hypothetical protein